MPNDYYNLPLRFDMLVKGTTVREDPAKATELMCSLDESIQNHVYLIITTQFNEARYRPEFGCTIWDEDFHISNDWNDTHWTDRIEESVKEGIRRQEPRLERIQVRAEMNRKGSSDAHKRLVITVTAEVRKSEHRPFRYEREILIAPFSTNRRE